MHIHLFAIDHNTEGCVNNMSVRVQTEGSCKENPCVPRISVEEITVIVVRIARSRMSDGLRCLVDGVVVKGTQHVCDRSHRQGQAKNGRISHRGHTVCFVVSISERTFKSVCGVALGSLCLIVFTGALVRLTGSGLGCSDWPQCNETRFVDVSSGHTLIEQANRLFTGVVSFSVIAAVLLAHLRSPKRRDLVVLAWGLVVGVVAQIIIGGIVVLTGLNPFANMAHFLVSMLLVANAFVLFRRAAGSRSDTIFRQLPTQLRLPSFALVVFSCSAVVTGTVVTATGPHAGDEDAVRFGFALISVARIHSLCVIATVSLLVYLIVSARRLKCNVSFTDALSALTVVAVFQAAIGYTQYFTDVPVVLVAAHILGATAFWLAVCNVLVAPSLPESQRAESTI